MAIFLSFFFSSSVTLKCFCLSLLRFVIINVKQDAISGLYSDIYCCLWASQAELTVIKVERWWLTAGPTRWTLASALESCFSKRCCCGVQLLPWGQTRFPPQEHLSEPAGWIAGMWSLSLSSHFPPLGVCQIKGSVDVDRNHCVPLPVHLALLPCCCNDDDKKKAAAAASKQPEGILKGGGWGRGADYPGSLLNIKEGCVKLIAQPWCLYWDILTTGCPSVEGLFIRVWQ